MRQFRKAGEKLFVDYAGQTVPKLWSLSGEVKPARAFVAALGASGYTYAETASGSNWQRQRCSLKRQIQPRRYVPGVDHWSPG